MEFITAMSISLGFFFLIGWIIYTLVERSRSRERLRVLSDFHTRLIDRMGSAKDFGEFMDTNGGKRFIESLTVEKAMRPADRIIRSIHIGLVLTLLGVGMFAASQFAEFETDGLFEVMGIIFMFVGIGFLLASGASYSLSRRLGLLEGTTVAHTEPRL
jgi:hypothetical protein